jgi:hypothetical protein
MSLIDHIRWQEIPLPGMAAEVHVPLKVGEFGSGGPVIVITAGIHGDEGPWGAWAIHQMLSAISPDSLTGTIRIVPVANPLAMQADLRNAPVDQLDLNRVFPGDARGSYTERVAYALTQHVLVGADYAIDLHGGGSWCVNSFVFEMQGGETLAASFEAPFIVRAPERNVTLTGYARTQGTVATAVEMGGRSEYEAVWAQRIADGLLRALTHIGVIEGVAVPAIQQKAVRLGSSSVLRPSAGGILMPGVRADSVGQIVSGGTVLGYLLDPYTHQVREEFVAPFPQTAIMLLRPTVCRIEGGAMTYVVAEPVIE